MYKATPQVYIETKTKIVLCSLKSKTIKTLKNIDKNCITVFL